jgi:FkbM family methyltransferase
MWGGTDINHAFGTYREVGLQRTYRVLLDKRVPGSIRKLLKRYMKNIYGADAVIDHTDRGIRLRCYPFQNVHDMKFATGQLFFSDNRKFDFIQENIDYIDCIIDVGANTGTICIPLAMMCPKKKIFAFEPNLEAFARLQFNHSLNYVPNLTLINAALGEEAAQKKLFVSGNIGGGSIYETAKGRGFDVDMMRLDEFFEKESIGERSAVKIDVEGYEDRVIMPLFQNTSREKWPALVILEHIHKHLWQRDCIEFMLQNGYRLAHADGSDSFLERKMSAGL